MDTRPYTFVVVGSGMGGATLALELAGKGKDVLLLERGKRETDIGTFKESLRYYDNSPVTHDPKRSAEGTILWRTLMAGGSTSVCCGNGVRCLQTQLAGLGIDLEREFSQMEERMRVAPIAEKLLGPGSAALADAARDLGYTFSPMPKFIDPDRCIGCGNCVEGCRSGARWSAADLLPEFERLGGEIVYGVTVERVLSSNGSATGVEGRKDGRPFSVKAERVVLAAGGLGSPPILQQSGIEAGRGLFMDLFVNVYGSAPGLGLLGEPLMPLVDTEFHAEKGFILSPYVNHPRAVRAIELGMPAAAVSSSRLIGLMVKTADDRTGQVFADGRVSKPVLPADQKRIDDGVAIAKEILVKAGAGPKSLAVSKVQGAHPGGTAAIGEVVDRNLETAMSGLFCCDASVLPATPGFPPMLTIGALALYLAGKLAA